MRKVHTNIRTTKCAKEPQSRRSEPVHKRNMPARILLAIRRIIARIHILVTNKVPPSNIDSATLSTLCDEVKDFPGPITHVSDPLLRRIFEMGKTTSCFDPPFELTVTHVNSRWRKIAIGVPDLWTKIDTCLLRVRQLEMLETYLQRSNERSIDIRLSFSQEIWSTIGPDLFAMLGTHVARWRRLWIQADFEEAQPIISAYLGYLYAPCLEHLSIICLDEPDLPYSLASTNFSPSIFRSGVPKLSVVRLQNLGMSSFRPPLTNITTLHLEDFRHAPMQYFRFCSMISSLRSLINLSVYGNFVTFWPNATEIHIPSLRSLRSSSNEALSGFILSISAPQSESLTLKNVEDYDLRGFWKVLNTLSAPKFPALRFLSLNDLRVSESAFTNFFRAFPLITHLELVNLDAGKLLGHLFQGLPSTSVPLWNLHTLTIHQLNCPVDLDAVIIARIVAGRPIRKFQIHRDLMARVKDSWSSWKEIAQVEEWDKLDPWPAGIDYDDDDDMFLRLSYGSVTC